MHFWHVLVFCHKMDISEISISNSCNITWVIGDNTLFWLSHVNIETEQSNNYWDVRTLCVYIHSSIYCLLTIGHYIPIFTYDFSSVCSYYLINKEYIITLVFLSFKQIVIKHHRRPEGSIEQNEISSKACTW